MKTLLYAMTLVFFLGTAACSEAMKDFVNVNKDKLLPGAGGGGGGGDGDSAPTVPDIQVSTGAVRATGSTLSSHIKTQYHKEEATGTTLSSKLSVSGQTFPQ